MAKLLKVLGVLILVLMEDTLRVGGRTAVRKSKVVLILVLMEDTLRGFKSLSNKSRE